MFLNWLVFIPLLLFALMLPRIVLSAAYLGNTLGYDPKVYAIGAPAFAITAGLFFAIAIFNLLRYLPSIGNKDHTEEDFLKFCLGPLLLATLAIFIMEIWFTGGDASKNEAPVVTFRGWFLGIAASGGAGWLAYLVSHKELWSKWKLVLAFSVALLLTVLSLAGAAWLLSHAFSTMSWSGEVTLALPLFLLAFALAVTLFVGLTSNVLGDEDREWLARAGAWVLLTILIWAGLCGLVLLVPRWALHISARAESEWATAGGLSGVIAALVGFSSNSKSKNESKNSGGPPTEKPGMKDKLVEFAGKLAAPVFIVIFLTALVLLTNVVVAKAGFVTVPWREHESLLEATPVKMATILALIFLVFSVIMARYININKFSLQAMYRSRIIRAYLGASNEQRHTNPFTGFADNDDLTMTNLASDSKPFFVAQDDVTMTRDTASLKPFHVVNVTLNLVSGERLAWQQRKAESFTVSPLHCGYGDSYRPAARYAGGISLGTAVAISGAAASPNMGYHTESAMAFVMTLFNARLGSWLGNPKRKKWKLQGPRSAFDSIVREAFGLTNDRSPYVYLSDGGHFENLALYEMVRRHCRHIIVLDGGADSNFSYEDLGNALRKIRIDMKIDIKFEEPFLKPLKKPRYRCAIGRIHYNALDPMLEDGYLIYIKPMVLGNEPPDVTTYKAANQEFPHQSTADQFFDESQTESYRMLGICSINQIFKGWDHSKDFEGILESARTYLGQGKAIAAAAAAGKG